MMDGSFSISHWLIIAFVVIVGLIILFDSDILSDEFKKKITKYSFLNIKKNENDVSNSEFLKRISGLLGLLFLFSVAFSLFQIGNGSIGFFIGQAIGSFFSLVLISAIFPMIIWFSSLALGRKIYRRTIFHIFIVCCFLSVILVLIGFSV